MTSTAVMPARSSLRVSRNCKDPNDTGENVVEPPPPKRPRLNPVPSRRRKSSPDLLDTTIDSTPPSAASTKLRRPRPLFALSAPRTTSSPPPGAGAGAGTPRARNLRLQSHTHTHAHNHEISHSTSALYLNGGRESPDPLDTISPAPAPAPKSAPRPAPTAAATPTSAAYRHRRVTQPSKPESGHHTKEKAPSRPKDSAVRTLRSAAAPAPRDESVQQSQTLPVPVETAERGQEKRRSLRSHDGGSRAKSELAQYFPNYDQLISLEPPKTEILSGNTVIKLIDDLTEPISKTLNPGSDKPFGNPLVNLHNCEAITLPEPDLNPAEEEQQEEDQDPLNEAHFFKTHRRHERQEKQLRNIERDRAQHEKQNLDRLLDELKSQDWLRVLGITGSRIGIPEHEKKQYEPKREFFIAEISAVLKKFQIWREEEKRRRADKDKTNSFYSETTEPLQVHAKDHEVKDEEETSEPPPDDVDALAARQLLQEARSAGAGKRPSTNTKPTPKPQPEPEHLPIPPPPDPLKPFTSFFSKPHLREQAMSGNRKGRTRLAFGHPVPEMQEREFELPEDILTTEAIKDCQRKRRRLKRGSLD